MAYRVYTAKHTQWVRLIHLEHGTAHVCKPFETEWTCDPCNPYRTRYTVRHPAGQISHAWHEVITNDDNARTRYHKLCTARKVARLAMMAAYAERMYRQYADGSRTDHGIADMLALMESSSVYLQTH